MLLTRNNPLHLPKPPRRQLCLRRRHSRRILVVAALEIVNRIGAVLSDLICASVMTSPRDDSDASSDGDSDFCEEQESSAHDPLRVTSAKKGLPSESDDTAATNMMRISFSEIGFRQHETVIAVAQGGMSTVPTSTLGRVTEYTDHKCKSVDEYEEQRVGKRKKYTQLDCSPPRSRMLTSPRGKQRKQELEAMRIKSMKQDDDGEEKTNNNNPQRLPCKATNKSNGKRDKGIMAKQGLLRGRSTPLKESFNKFRSSVTEMSKQVAERWSVLFAPSQQ